MDNKPFNTLASKAITLGFSDPGFSDPGFSDPIIDIWGQIRQMIFT